MGYTPDYVVYHELIMTSKVKLQNSNWLRANDDCVLNIGIHAMCDSCGSHLVSWNGSPMFYSVKQAGAGRSQKRRQAQETMSTMEEEMKLAQEQMIAEKEEQIKKEASIRKKSVCKFFS